MTQAENASAGMPKMNPVGSQEVPAELKAAVAQAFREEFAVTEAWKPRQRIRFRFTCPSGQPVLLQHLTTMDLLEADLIEEIDFFTKRLFPSNIDQNGNPVDENKEDEDSMDSVWGLLKDVNKRARFFALLNKIMVVGVVRPRILDDGVETYTNKAGKQMVRLGMKKIEPQEGQVLASAIDFADRMAIFAELNRPLNEIKPFRKEQVAGVANMESMQSVTDKT